MFNHRFTTCVVPALSLLLFVPSADGQQSGRPITPSTRQSSPSRHYFTVIGAVGVPGVYEYSSGLPTLADVIHAANGLTSEASGTFRIVRNEIASRQMFYSPDSPMRLLSGDILILDKSHSGTPRGGRSSTGYESQSLVQIVAVNLIHRPVVLSLPSELATLERLVTDLNQSPNIIPTVKILQAKTSGYVGPSGNSAKFRLISESVLIFNPSVVRIDQIPKLPPVYKPKVRTASYRQILAPSSGNSLYGNSKSAIELAAGSSSQGHSVPIDHSEKMLQVPPPLENASLHKAKPAYENPEFWTPVNKGHLSTKPPADGWKNAPDSLPPFPPTDPLAFLPDEKGASKSAEKSTVPSATPEITNPIQAMLLQGLIAVGCVGLLTAGWLFRRKLQQRLKPQYDFQSVKKKTGGILDALIEEKLSLVEEQFIFPKGLELRVPTVPPISQRKTRVDSSHTLLRPHLPSEFAEPVPDYPHSVTKTSQIDAVPEIPSVVSGLREPVEIFQQRRDVPQSEALLQSIEQNSETGPTRFPETESFTAYVYSTTWPESASESEPAVDSDSDSPSRTVPSRNESTSTSSELIHRIDSLQTPSLRPHARHSGWVLDRVLVALHGVTRQ